MADIIKVEKMSPKDVIVYKADMEEFEDTAWADELFDEFIGDPYAYFFKAALNGESAGYCSIYHNTMRERHFCKIMDLRVKQAFRRKGVAKALMLKILALANELGLDRTKLEVNTQNGAIKLYESLGFQIEETEEGFYDDGGDAYIMWRYEHGSAQHGE